MGAQPALGWDFFVSYAAAGGVDLEWAEWIAWQLEDVGYQVKIRSWDSVAGSNWLTHLQQVAEHETRTIALFSRAYLACQHGEEEWRAAQRFDQAGIERRLLPVRLENVALPKLLDGIRSIDLFEDDDEDGARRRLIDEIAKAVAGRGKPRRPPAYPLLKYRPPFPGATAGRAIVAEVTAADAAGPEVFVGRDNEVRRLVELLNQAGTGTTTVTLTGPGGIGKTALARRAAAVMAGDQVLAGGAFIVDMHGYRREARAGSGQVYAGQVYAPLLASLCPDRHIPATIDKQAKACRQELARRAEQSKPVLLVLDNVSHPTQITGLLRIVHPTHRVLVTSRDTLELDAVDAVDDVKNLSLEALTPGDAVQLLREMLRRRGQPDNGNRPDDKMAGEPDPAEARLAEQCGKQPLALRIAAALLADSGRSVTDLVADLAKVPVPPDDPDQDGKRDGRSGVYPILRLSWDHLTRCDSSAAELLWLLSVNPGPEISTDAAAALVGWQPWRASRNLRKLHRAELIRADATTGRWGVHDVVSAHLHRLPKPDGIIGTDADAFDRLLRYYQTKAADRAIRAGWFLLRHSRPTNHPSPPPDWSERGKALDWFTTEQPNLFGCVQAIRLGRRAVKPGRGAALLGRLDTAVGRLDTAAGRHRNRQRALVALIDAMAGYLRNNGPWEKAAEMHRLAADTAGELGDTRAQGTALNDLGITYRLLGPQEAGNPPAIAALEQARLLFCGLRLFRRRAAWLGQANALNEQGIVYNEGRNYADALEVLERALRLYRMVSDDIGIANASKNLGVAVFKMGLDEDGDPLMRDAAQEPLNEALAQYEKIGDRLGVAETRNRIGQLCLESRQLKKARGEFEAARKLAGEAHSLLEQARACEGIGDCRASDDRDVAISSYQSALESYSMIGAVKDFDRAKNKLDSLQVKFSPW
jgi:tetratricopeptide (TPR) repeat protein